MVSVFCDAAQKTLLFGLRAPGQAFLTELGPDVVEKARQIGMLPAAIMSLEKTWYSASCISLWQQLCFCRSK